MVQSPALKSILSMPSSLATSRRSLSNRHAALTFRMVLASHISRASTLSTWDASGSDDSLAACTSRSFSSLSTLIQ
ncbi:hypothetical protein BpHYR1_029019 [Brachionus plicatilis]|uniref:Uncharacterized protein n=1 Tax=Brachionus plicatilis TaxID=10195 RepID=A0A3M7SWT5_BRAPC|nr:hypothetical protein BpHYR1_029019 [Brachionus plicatilis]